MGDPGGTCTLTSISTVSDDTCSFSIAEGDTGNDYKLRVTFDNSANQNSDWLLTVITNGRG